MGRTVSSTESSSYLLKKYDDLRARYELKEKENRDFLEECVGLHMKVREQAQRLYEMELAAKQLLVYKNSCISTFTYLQGRLGLASLIREIPESLREVFSKVIRDAASSSESITQNPAVIQIIQEVMQQPLDDDASTEGTLIAPPPAPLAPLPFSRSSQEGSGSRGSFGAPSEMDYEEDHSSEADREENVPAAQPETVHRPTVIIQPFRDLDLDGPGPESDAPAALVELSRTGLITTDRQSRRRRYSSETSDDQEERRQELLTAMRRREWTENERQRRNEEHRTGTHLDYSSFP